MKVGYCVPIAPQLASYRLRVAIPAPLLGCDYAIGVTGKPTFFFKQGYPQLAANLSGVVYDVVNDHFRGNQAADYHAMCDIADRITVASEAMAETVRHHTGRDAIVIDDPYENDEQEPGCKGEWVLWFGHSANLSSLLPHWDAVTDAGAGLLVCTNSDKASVQWSLETERSSLEGCAVVLMTGNNPGASSNRIVKALRAGRFVVTPGGVPAWDQFAPYIWIGDVREGIEWAFKNREQAIEKVRMGQEYVREAFAPRRIAAQWMEVFASI